MGSKKRRREKPSEAPPPRTSRARLVALALLIAVVAGVTGGVLSFLIRRPKPITVDAGRFTIEPGARPAGEERWPDDATVYAAYAGSDSCKECHWDAHAFWSRSHHGRAERAMDMRLDRPAFDPPVTLKHGSQTTQIRLRDGKFEVVAAGPDGKVEAYEAHRAIGVSPLVQYLLHSPGGSGRLQALEAAYDPHNKQWFNIYGEEDRKPGEWGHWSGRGMNWNSQCAACHNTRVRKNYDAAADRYDTKMAQMTVSCESCHGPMKAHVDWRLKYPHATEEDRTIKPVVKERMFETCGSCHARRRDLTGEFAPGDSFYDHHQLTIPDETDLFYADGQVRDEDYEFGAFLGSRMHAAGVRCSDCHHPHTAKTVLPGNLLCMRCHGGPGTGSPFPNAPVIDEKAHTFHKPDSAGASCVGCHMPVTTYMQRHGRRDHGFTVPDPLITKELGIPNACNRCHTDKDVDWSLAAMNQWYGQRMELPNRAAARTRTRAIAAARHGDDGARDPLLAIATAKDTSAYWRAVSLGLLEPWVGEANVWATLLAGLKDADPLVRGVAVRGLGPLVEAPRSDAVAGVTGLLGDPSRGVRLEAAWALRQQIDLSTGVGRELLTSLQYHLDQPGGHMQMGALLASRGRFEEALREFNKAIEWDPNSPPFRYEAAVVLSQLGRSAEAKVHLEEAVRQAPANAEFHYALGLAQHEAGDLEKAIASLREAVRLNPGRGRAWYNLGLALDLANRKEEAVAALVRAERAEPADPTIPFARATVLAKMDQREQAAQAARRALAIRPDYAEAARLLRALGQPP